MPFIIVKNDGHVVVMQLLEGTDPEAEIAKWTNEDREAVSHVYEVADEAVPGDHTFFAAWQCEAGTLTVNMEKAREVHRDNLRALRAPKLEALDIEYQRADERGSVEDKATVAAAKQTLRDVTADPAIDAAQTPEALKAAIPLVLID